jgi:uncharacterized protein with GYD domain
LKKGGDNWNFETLIIKMGIYEIGGVQMPTYMTLIKYTQKGVENMKDSPNRLDMAKELFKSMGGELKSFYLAMGRYDAVVIAEGPDDETATKLALTIGAGGAIRTETFRVFPEDEYRKIISELP